MIHNDRETMNNVVNKKNVIKTTYSTIFTVPLSLLRLLSADALEGMLERIVGVDDALQAS